MSYCKASEVRISQRIKLDMGCDHPMDETCVVLSVDNTNDFFGNNVIRFKVRRPGGGVINVVDYLPNGKVEVPDELA